MRAEPDRGGPIYVVKATNHVFRGTMVSESETEFQLRTGWGSIVSFKKSNVTISKEDTRWRQR